MVSIMARVISLFLAYSLVACAGSRISTVSLGDGRKVDHPVKTIAMAPSGGLFADAIAVELANRGFHVIDTAQTSQLLVRLNLNEVEVTQPQNLARLRDGGIDAYLSARAAAGYDGRPQSASVRVNSTYNGTIIAGLSWQNGWGGMAGSMADRTMRKDLVQAAIEIAEELTKRLKTP
jgi:hypothetical protein